MEIKSTHSDDDMCCFTSGPGSGHISEYAIPQIMFNIGDKHSTYLDVSIIEGVLIKIYFEHSGICMPVNITSMPLWSTNNINGMGFRGCQLVVCIKVHVINTSIIQDCQFVLRNTTDCVPLPD